jgi:hypothetical protein
MLSILQLEAFNFSASSFLPVTINLPISLLDAFILAWSESKSACSFLRSSSKAIISSTRSELLKIFYASRSFTHSVF